MGSYKYDLVIEGAGIGHEGEELFDTTILENGVKIGKYETPDYGGLPEFSFVSETKKNEFFEYATEIFSTDVREVSLIVYGIQLIEALFDEILSQEEA